MEPIISSKTQMCRICPNTNDLTVLTLLDLENLESFVLVEIELSEQLPKYICVDCNSAFNNALQFKAKISERFEEIKTLIEISLKPSIKSELVYEIEEVMIEEQIFKVEEPPEQPRKTNKSKLSTNYNRTCIYCPEKVTSYKELIEHNKTHTDCPICLKKYTCYKNFKSHYSNTHLNNDQKYSCELCGKEFERKKNIAIHIRAFHNQERNHACDICDKVFFGKTALEKHSTIHSDERPFVCRICTKGFKLLVGLKIHEQLHEETKSTENKYRKNRTTNQNLSLYICTFCGKQSRGQTAFQVHQRIHTNELPYECDVCNKKFRASISLTLHKRIHTGEKPYKCDLCQKQFRIQHYLTTHKLSHGGSNIEKFSCNLCGMSTVYEKNLDTHMKTVHMLVKNFDCKICGESFTKISLLKKHSMDSHNLLLE